MQDIILFLEKNFLRSLSDFQKLPFVSN